MGYLPVLVPVALQTSNYSALANQFVPCDVTSGGFTVTLPTAPADGTRIGIKLIRGQTAANFVTYACGGTDTLNATAANGGVTTGNLILKSQSETMQYQASTGIWYLQAGDTPVGQLDLRYTSPRNVVAKSATYSALAADIVLCTAGAGGFTVTLPAAVLDEQVIVKKVDSGAGSITITPASGTIDGQATLVIAMQYEGFTMVSDGTNWFVIA